MTFKRIGSQLLGSSPLPWPTPPPDPLHGQACQPRRTQDPLHGQPCSLDVQRVLCTVRPALLNVQRPLCTVRPALVDVQRALCTVRPALLDVQRALCTVRPAPWTYRGPSARSSLLRRTEPSARLHLAAVPTSILILDPWPSNHHFCPLGQRGPE